MILGNLIKKILFRSKRLKTICYVSTHHTGLSDFAIDRILKSAQIYNNKHGVSGVFVSASNRFFQILEGDEKEINLLFDRIQRDDRHTNIIKLFNTTIDRPFFTSYNSSFRVALGSEEIKEVNKYLAVNSDYPFSQNVVGILKSLALSARLG